MMLVIELVPNDLSTKLRYHSCALKLLNEGLPERVEASLGWLPALPHLSQVPAEGFGDPIALPIDRRGLGCGEQPRLTGLTLATDPIQEAHFEELGMERHRPKAHFGLHLLVLAFVGDADTWDAVLLEH
jgi:hypothetical protein